MSGMSCVNKYSMLLRHMSIDSVCHLQSSLWFQFMKKKCIVNQEKTGKVTPYVQRVYGRTFKGSMDVRPKVA